MDILVISLCVLHEQVAKVYHEVFNNWKQVDGIPQCDTVIAYLEDENSGYIVKEYFENSMVFHLHCNKINSIIL